MKSAYPDHVVVVGASLAGLRACEAARREGYGGRLTLIGAEEHLPYDRPPLSKEYLDSTAEVEPPLFPGSTDVAHALRVDLRLGHPATGLDVADHLVEVGDDTVPYDALVIATGASARTLPGMKDLSGIHTLRTVDEALEIRSGLESGARVVVVGGGFIGSEVASAARKRNLPVTIIEAEPTPLVRAVGEQAGQALTALHNRNGTDLLCGVGVESFLGTGQVEAVRLTDGTELPADLVVVGVGASPNTDWLEGSGLTIDNGVVCDAQLQAAADVYAAGDVARWLSPDFGVFLRLEHWTNAADQAAHAVRNLLDPIAATPYHHIPYFWSDWYGARIQFVGIPTGEPTVVTGDWEEDAFTALYREDDRLIGALCLNRRADIMKYRALIARGASWEEGLELAAQRNAIIAAKGV